MIANLIIVFIVIHTVISLAFNHLKSLQSIRDQSSQECTGQLKELWRGVDKISHIKSLMADPID